MSKDFKRHPHFHRIIIFHHNLSEKKLNYYQLPQRRIRSVCNCNEPFSSNSLRPPSCLHVPCSKCISLRGRRFRRCLNLSCCYSWRNSWSCWSPKQREDEYMIELSHRKKQDPSKTTIHHMGKYVQNLRFAVNYILFYFLN